jgi:UDP-N-acetylglucosamine--N-acetylmuramyl-(pentapeptide) pyrophosphoryl-undecaprenol N-acetylglucosamine transferase
MKVLFACAGTGGHLIPAIVLARGLLKRDSGIDILFCLADDGRGVDILEKEGFPWTTVPVKPFPRLMNVENLWFPISVLRGIRSSLSVLNRYNPQVVVGTGGYVSGPVLLAAWLRRIPVMIQEQNNIPGLTNRFLAPLVDEIHVSYPEVVDSLLTRRKKVFLTGNPVACGNNGEGAVEPIQRQTPGDPPVVLVMGGSQGAHSINRVVVRYLRSFETIPYRVFMQTGERDYEWVCASLSNCKGDLLIQAFFDDLPARYREIDLAICRAGAMTLSEISFWGIPSVLIPYPHATAAHQEQNARHYEREGAAYVLEDLQMDWRVLREIVENVLGNVDTWRKMRQATYALRRPEAKEILVGRIIDLGRAKGFDT